MELNESELEQAINQLSTNKSKVETIKNLIQKGVDVPIKHVKLVIKFYNGKNQSRTSAELAEKAAHSAKKAGFDEKSQKIFSMTIKIYEALGLTYRWYTKEAMEEANKVYHAAVRVYDLGASKYGTLERDVFKKIALLARESGLQDKENEIYKKILKSNNIDSSWISKEIGYENIEKIATEALDRNQTGLIKLLFEHYESVQRFEDAERLAKHLEYKDKTDAYKTLKELLN